MAQQKQCVGRLCIDAVGDAAETCTMDYQDNEILHTVVEKIQQHQKIVTWMQDKERFRAGTNHPDWASMKVYVKRAGAANQPEQTGELTDLMSTFDNGPIISVVIPASGKEYTMDSPAISLISQLLFSKMSKRAFTYSLSTG